MYSFVRSISFILRVYLCYCTIDNVPIIEDPLRQELFSEIISLYTILWALSYYTNGIIIREFQIQSATIRAIFYFFIYLIYMFIMFGILKLLTLLNILPI